MPPTTDERLDALEADMARMKQRSRRTRARLRDLIATLAALASNGRIGGALSIRGVKARDDSDGED